MEDPRNSWTKSRSDSLPRTNKHNRRGALHRRKTDKRPNSSIGSLVQAAVLAGHVAAAVRVKESEPQMSGYLSRRSGDIWVMNWYVLKDMVLHVYHDAPPSDDQDEVPLDVLPVLGYFVETVDKVYFDFIHFCLK